MCTVSANCAQCPQTVHSVYKLCTVSTDCTLVNRYVYSAYKLVHSVYRTDDIFLDLIHALELVHVSTSPPPRLGARFPQFTPIC